MIVNFEATVLNVMLKLFFQCSIVSLILCKEYLNMAAFRISLLLLMKS